MPDLSLRCTAFAGTRRIASGELRHVALKARHAFASGGRVLVFEDASGRQLDLPLELPEGELLRRLGQAEAAPEPAAAPARGPGRPKLGVVAREVTLLPRHWQWLAAQPGGASVALRKLVDAARRENAAGDSRRAAQERAYRFMSAMAGDRSGFDEAARALFAGDAMRFDAEIAAWPDDLREHATMLAADAWPH